MRLVPFHARHAALVLSWVRDVEDLDRWAALREQPSPTIFESWHEDPDVQGHLLLDDDPVGYGELWVSAEEDEVELARLLVRPDRRGRGVGRRLVEALLEAARPLSMSTAWVRVVSSNAPALRCYRSAGFERADAESERRFNEGQPRSYQWHRRGLLA